MAASSLNSFNKSDGIPSIDVISLIVVETLRCLRTVGAQPARVCVYGRQEGKLLANKCVCAELDETEKAELEVNAAQAHKRWRYSGRGRLQRIDCLQTLLFVGQLREPQMADLERYEMSVTCS